MIQDGLVSANGKRAGGQVNKQIGSGSPMVKHVEQGVRS
jgi:hypothetical protein